MVLFQREPSSNCLFFQFSRKKSAHMIIKMDTYGLRSDSPETQSIMPIAPGIVSAEVYDDRKAKYMAISTPY